MTPEQFCFYVGGFLQGRNAINKKEFLELKRATDAICSRIVDGQVPLVSYKDIKKNQD